MQAYLPSDADTRTFGDQIERTIKDLARPDLTGEVQKYLRDAIRFYSRDPFFFNQADNSDVQGWVANLHCPQGYTIIDSADDGNDYIFVNLVAGICGAVKPTLDSDLFVFTGSSGIIFTAGQAGTTTDNECTWATVIAFDQTQKAVNNFWTELSTVPTVNQYVPPIDFVSPRRVEITAAGLRYRLHKQSYNVFRNWDVVRPAPVTVYPTEWTWFQEKFYLWPYPSAFYPITLSYYNAPFPPRTATDTNFWTTDAEALIRAAARSRIQAEIIKDVDAATVDDEVARREFDSLKGKEVLQESSGPIPLSDEW